MIRNFKDDCFMIMPVGKDDVNTVCQKVYNPIANEFHLNYITAENSEDGSSITESIYEWIQHSKIIIADLTYARPNCYHEVGFAYGKDLHRHLILCCRSDHNPDDKNYTGEYKLHFDLSTNYCIWWDSGSLDSFKDNLRKKIKHRIGLIEKYRKPIEDKKSSEKIFNNKNILNTTKDRFSKIFENAYKG